MQNALRYHGYIPGIIVSAVYSDSVTKAGKCSVQLLCQNKLMTQQSVSISKAWVHLRKTDGRAGSEIQLTCRSPAYWAKHIGHCIRSPGLLSGRIWWQYHVPSVDWNSFLRHTKPSKRDRQVSSSWGFMEQKRLVDSLTSTANLSICFEISNNLPQDSPCPCQSGL